MLVLSEDNHKARKRHVCDSCMRHIEPGEVYRRARIVNGGDAWVFKAHTPCHKAGLILADKGYMGDDDALVNVIDMEREDRETVAAEDPEVARKCWPEKDLEPEPRD